MASRFWVGGTGTWDASDTTHWAATSGGAGGQSVPGSSDTVTFDGSSGGGTVTLNFGGPITVQSITMGAFTGTWDNSVNNNNITVTANGSSFSGSGSGARTISLGSATYTLSGVSSAKWDFTTVTNLTLSANTATISFTGAGATKTFTGGTSKTYGGTVTFAASTNSGTCAITTSFTVANLTITAPNYFILPTASTPAVSTAFTAVGTSSNQIGIIPDTIGLTGGLSVPASQTIQWCAIRECAFTSNTLTAISSFNLIHNTGVTITPPSQASFSGGFFG